MKQVPFDGIKRPLVQKVAPVPISNGPVIERAGLPNVIDAPLSLVRVTWVKLLTEFTACVGKAIEPGVRTTWLVPVPLNPTTCGLLGSLSSIANAPFLTPVLLGLKTTLIVHFAPAAKVLPVAGHLFDATMKSASVMETAPNVMGADPLLVMVTVFAALVVFTA